MVEFELKFKINKSPKNIINFPKIDELVEKDIYYDTSNYNLLKEGDFFRVRNNEKIDFKLNIGDEAHLYCKETNFNLKDINPRNKHFIDIFDCLNIKLNLNFTNFESFIKLNNFIELAVIDKKREIYKIDGDTTVTIDDVENLGTFLEAEIILDNIEKITDKNEIKAEIINKLKILDIIKNSSKLINIGYVESYLFKNNKKVYNLGKFVI